MLYYCTIMEFPVESFKPIKNSFTKARGGASKFLYVACSNCEEPAMVYQKDGPGRLLRMYADRIVWPPELVESQREVNADTVKQAGAIACSSCNHLIGTPMVYTAENRAAYRVEQGSIHAYRSAEQAKARATEKS